MLTEATIKKIVSKVLLDTERGVVDESGIQDGLLLIQEFISEKKEERVSLHLNTYSLNEINLFNLALKASIDYFCNKYTFTLITKNGKFLTIS